MKVFALLVFSLGLSSCSMVDNVALKATARIVKAGSEEVLTESNWHNFNIATPGNLKLAETLWYSDQGNKEILTVLIKGYGAYALASSETLALADIVLEEDESFYKTQAILNYEKATFYGMKYLEQLGIGHEEFLKPGFPSELESVFNLKVSESDYTAIFYLAQSLGGSVNLQRDNVVKMGYFSHVREMLSWVCAKKPDLEYGSCSLFKAVIESSTPTVMGGSPDKAQKLFRDFIRKNPENLLARLSYIQYYLIPMLEEDEFSKEMEKLNRDLNQWFSLQKGMRTKQNQRFASKRELNLFNSIAFERYKTLKKLKKEIF